MASTPVTRNRLKLWARFSTQFSQHLPDLLGAGQREQPLQSDASGPICRHQGRFTFYFCEDILDKHLCERWGEYKQRRKLLELKAEI